MTTLVAVPNFSEGRDQDAIGAVTRAFGGRRLNLHSDPDHNRSVITLAGAPGELAPAVLAGAKEVVNRIDLARHEGAHPRIGALDVAPIVYLDEGERGAACAEALVLGDLIAHELKVPVFLYGPLAPGRSRAELRRGGPGQLAQRMLTGELRPDFGPPELHPSAGATLVAARPPLVAFNFELAPPATLEDARAIAARIRDGGSEGLASVRAIGVSLARRGIAQVSINVEDPGITPLAAVLAAIERHAPVTEAELVGLAPEVALAGFPDRVPIRGRATIEAALSD